MSIWQISGPAYHIQSIAQVMLQWGQNGWRNLFGRPGTQRARLAEEEGLGEI